MSFFTNIRADRFITELKTATDVAAPATQKAIAKLRELGPGAIEPVTAALADADKIATVAYIEVLTGLVNQKTFPKFIESMVTGSPRVVAGVAWALSSSRAYPPTMLLDALSTEGVAKSALLDVITAHRSRLSVREILAAAYKQEANEKAALFRILGELATDNDLPELDRPPERQGSRSRACTSSTSCRASRSPKSSARCSSSSRTPTSWCAPPPSARSPRWTARSKSSRSARCCAIRRSTCRTRPSTWSSARTIRRRSST